MEHGKLSKSKPENITSSAKSLSDCVCVLCSGARLMENDGPFAQPMQFHLHCIQKLKVSRGHWYHVNNNVLTTAEHCDKVATCTTLSTDLKNCKVAQLFGQSAVASRMLAQQADVCAKPHLSSQTTSSAHLHTPVLMAAGPGESDDRC